MTAVEVLNTTTSNSPLLLGCAIDRPAPGERLDIHALQIEGWAVAKTQPLRSIEIVCDDTVLGATTVDRARPDVAPMFPEHGSLRCGFRQAVSLLGLRGRQELLVRAVLDNQRRIRVGTVEIQRQPLQLPAASIQPLMITTLGRTGSTWLSHLLGCHPKIVCYRPFQYESRVANYWVSVLKALSEPNSYLHALGTDLHGGCWWLHDRVPTAAFPLLDPIIQERLGGGNIQDLASFCRDSADRFYARVADLQGKSDAGYFVEKASPGHHLQPLFDELYPGSREILLIRDLRDMVCSILAYNEKREMKGFGRGFAASDEAYVHRLRNSALSLLRSWKSRSRTSCLVRYEELVRNPGETLRSILRFLGLSSTPLVVGDVLDQAGSEMAGAQKMHQTSNDPSASIGRWQSELEPRMKSACGEAFDDILQEFGYVSTEPIAGR